MCEECFCFHVRPIASSNHALSIPQGIKGFPGLAGNDGVPGARGGPGPRGSQGDRGPIGAQVKSMALFSTRSPL